MEAVRKKAGTTLVSSAERLQQFLFSPSHNVGVRSTKAPPRYICLLCGFSCWDFQRIFTQGAIAGPMIS